MELPVSAPHLSIVIPTWNRSRYLEQLLESIASQASALELTPNDLELVVGDNASTDGTPEVVRRYARRPHFKLESLRHAKNLGPGGNFMSVVAAATGEWLMVYGDDDLVAPGGLAAAIETTLRQAGALCVLFQQDPANRLYPERTERRTGAVEAARKYFYYAGNAGVFAVKTVEARSVISRMPADYPWTCWPQTEIMFRAAIEAGGDCFVFSPAATTSSPHHGGNTRYTSYYTLETGVLALYRATLQLESAGGGEVARAARACIMQAGRMLAFLREVTFAAGYVDNKNERRELRRAAGESLGYFKGLHKVWAVAVWGSGALPRWVPKVVFVTVRSLWRLATGRKLHGNSVYDRKQEESRGRSYAAGDLE